MLSSFWITGSQSIETHCGSKSFAMSWISLHVFPSASCGFTSPSGIPAGQNVHLGVLEGAKEGAEKRASCKG
jgi:hypothetical protein